MADKTPTPEPTDSTTEDVLVSTPSSPKSTSSMAPAGEALKEEQDILITKYIQACQAGDLATVKDLIGSHAIDLGEDVDSNGVSGLHWASINNRLSVVKYLVEQGAEVDRVGGELDATPLHWACRYGLVYIVDYLTKHGADPTKADSQGFNALHLAVHSSNVMLVIYVLVFLPQVDVDLPDPNGRTALHWAAYQGDSLSVDVLLKFKASVRAVDSQGFTPLHWALIRGTKDCLSRLIEEGSDLTAKTNDGKDCFEISRDMNSVVPLQQALYEAGFEKDGTPMTKVFDEKQAKAITFLIPYPILGAVLKIFSDTNPIAAVACTAILFLATRKLLTRYLFPCYNRTSHAFLNSPILAGVFSATTFWVCVVWMTTLLPYTATTAPLSNLCFLLLASATVYAFQRSMFRNPGLIESPDSPEQIQQSITELLSKGKYDAKHFCVHTFIRKPVRSKYSSFSKKCVARFDHTCPWVYNDVGLRNHKVFLFFVISLALAILFYLRLVAKYFDVLEEETSAECSILDDEYCAGWTYSPFTFLLSCWASFQLVWVSFLLFSQCFQVIKGMTTLELSVLTRTHSPGANPYYSSAPPELMGSDTLSNNEQTAHSHRKTCLTSFCLVTGLNHFVIALKQSLGIKDTTTITEIPTDYGVKQNCIDFWFAAGDDHLDIRNLFKLPVKDEATLNGVKVNYYTLYTLPEKRPAYTDSAV